MAKKARTDMTEDELLEDINDELLSHETVPAEAVTSPEPKTIVVRAKVHTWGLDVGDMLELEETPIIRGLIAIGHFETVQLD